MPAQALQPTRPAPSAPGGPGRGAEARGGDGPWPEGVFDHPARFGLWAFMGTVTMLFLGFTSAYMLRRASPDWQPLRPPGLLWINTGVLLASSATLERARRRLRGWRLVEAQRWVGVAGGLGLLFLAGQLAAWRQLAAQGIFLASNPHSSFFYLLSGLHALHLLGALAWFLAVWASLRRLAVTPGEDGLGLFATFWHFLAIVWVYLVFLLFGL